MRISVTVGLNGHLYRFKILIYLSFPGEPCVSGFLRRSKFSRGPVIQSFQCLRKFETAGQYCLNNQNPLLYGTVGVITISVLVTAFIFLMKSISKSICAWPAEVLGPGTEYKWIFRNDVEFLQRSATRWSARRLGASFIHLSRMALCRASAPKNALAARFADCS